MAHIHRSGTVVHKDGSRANGANRMQRFFIHNKEDHSILRSVLAYTKKAAHLRAKKIYGSCVYVVVDSEDYNK